MMNGQQIIALAIVAAAAGYLIRSFVQAFRAFLSKKGGCASGCGKCAFAQQIKSAQNAAKTRANVIPLSDIRTQHKNSS